MGNLHIDAVLDIGSSGGIYQGTGSFASPSTGLKISNSGGIGLVQTFNSGILQVSLDTDGKFSAAAGKIKIDANGLIAYNASNLEQVKITTSGALVAAANNVILDRAGLRFIHGLSGTNQIGWADSFTATVEGYMYQHVNELTPELHIVSFATESVDRPFGSILYLRSVTDPITGNNQQAQFIIGSGPTSSSIGAYINDSGGTSVQELNIAHGAVTVNNGLNLGTATGAPSGGINTVNRITISASLPASSLIIEETNAVGTKLALFTGEPGVSYSNAILGYNYIPLSGGASGRDNTGIGGSFIRLQQGAIEFHQITSAGTDNTRIRIDGNGLGFFGATAVVKQTGGAATADLTYDATERDMINRMYTALRNYGLLT
jgi:hypothetical protein